MIEQPLRVPSDTQELLFGFFGILNDFETVILGIVAQSCRFYFLQFGQKPSLSEHIKAKNKSNSNNSIFNYLSYAYSEFAANQRCHQLLGGYKFLKRCMLHVPLPG
jgi:hypothetical protein